MNRIFRILWSKALRAWVVASELASPGGKNGRTVDHRAAMVDMAQVQGALEDSPPSQPWPLRLGILMALVALCAPAQAADRWWDPNNTAIGLGGSGTWNAGSAFWSPNNDGVSGPYSAWNNGALDDAFFGGTAGTVTLDGSITVHNLTFVTNGYILNGGTLILDGVDPTIHTGNGAVTQTINSVINSTSGLNKAGTGTLTLTASNSFNGGIVINGGRLNLDAANTFAGDINVNSGSVGVVGDAALGDIGNVLNMQAGTGLAATGALSSNRTVNLIGPGAVGISGGGVGSAFFTGAGGISASGSVAMSNDANDYTGSTAFIGSGTATFTSIGNLGEASSLGAPTTVANGTITFQNSSQTNHTLIYIGDGDTSNRNWVINPGSGPGGVRPQLRNGGTGTLTLTGNISLGGASGNGPQFYAQSADLELLGVISSNNARPVSFITDAGRILTLGDASTFTGSANVSGAGTVVAGTIADSGIASSLGAGTGANISGNGTLSYTGTGAGSNRNWSLSNGTLSNDGSGALTLSGDVAIGNTATLGGSFTGANNAITGVISGGGNLRSGGDGTWILTGINTYTGQTIVDSGVLRAGTADAFGASDTFVVNGGSLDLSSFDRTIVRLTGTGGTVNLGSATLTLEADEGVSATYAGSITGIGGLTKLGGSTQTLTGASTYTGDTTIGGGTLNLDFSGAGGPTSNIIGSGSTLSMGGGTLNVIGAAGEANGQTFDGLNITAGNNTIDASSGTGGSITVNLGAITRTGGLMNFNLPGSGNITTTNTALGGWATVNGTDYAKVVSGNILAFVEEDYTDKDNAANWLDNEFITDVSGFFGTVNGSVQLGGLRYTQPVSTTVTVEPGETLGVDGTIIVAPFVLGTNQLITGGMITGGIGGDLGVQQNGTGNFTIDSQVVDNGGPTGFIKAGTGLVTLGNANNSYTGSTLIAQGTLSVDHIADGGVNSSIGASSADSSNLVMEGGTLRYTGTGDTSDRGFTFLKSGDILGAGIEVTDANANLTFSGLVTSPDDANFTKSGAGTLTLANPNNDYVGITTVTGGLLSVNTLPNGGVVSPIGQSGSASANLVLDGGGLQYTGATTSTDRGFTLGTNHGTVDVADAGTTLTVSGTVVQAVGNRRLTKEGDGTLVLSGTNTYTGGNTVNGGTLRAGSTQAFGAPSTAAVMTLADTAGVTLDLDGFDNTIGPLNGGGANGGNVTLGSATLRIAGGNGNYSGVISGTGGILRTNGGIQTFNGCNHTYTGATTLEGSTLSTDCLQDGGLASGIGASGAASANLVFNAGSLTYTGGSVSIDRGFQLLGSGGINVTNAGTTLEFEGNAIGAGSLIKRNAGTLVLSGNNTYTGNTQVEGGVLRAAATNAFGPQGHMTLNNTAGVLLDLDSFDTVVTSLIGGGANGGNISLGSATLTLLDGATQSYAGAIGGTGNLVKNGNGLQALSGCNSSYSGTTTINAGVLQVNCLGNGGVNSSIGASSSAPANLTLNGGTLRYAGTGGSTDRQFTLGTNGGTIDASGTGAINFSSTAAVTLAGTNTARMLTLTGPNAGTNIFSAQLDDNGSGATSLTKTGTGLWRLTSATSSYTGVTTISGGILEVNEFADGGMASSIGASSNAAANLVIGNGSTLRYTGAGDTTDRQFTLATGVTFIESSGSGALQFTNTGAVALTGTNTARTIALGGTNTGDNTMGGAIGNNGTGATTLAKNDSGTWVLTGNNTYTGNTVINDGNLMIGNGGTTGNAGAGNVIIDSATSTLSLNRSDTFTFSGTLSGPGTLAQIGTGTSVLTSTTNQVGATTISAGTLEVDGGLTTPTIGMTGNAALTVDGTVRAAGPTQTAITGDAGDQTVTVNAGGTLLANGDLGDGNDTVDLSGTLDTGSGTLALGDGDDTLILNDGAQMLGAGVNAAGGGGTDTLVIDTALGFVLDGSDIDAFNILTKRNSGELTLTGEHDFDTGSQIEGGTLSVDGALITPALSMADDTTLNVDGLVQGAGETQTTLTGSAGDQTISVGSGGALLADGDLGDGNDAVTLAGLLDTGAGTLALGDGDDTLTLRDGAVIGGGGVAAGAGSNDTLILDNANALTFNGSQTAGFELLQKDNVGEATMTGSQSFGGGTALNAGTLTVAGDLETGAVDMADDTTLNVDGTLQGGLGSPVAITGSTGDNTVTVGADGTLLANGDLGEGNDALDIAGTLDTGGGVFALGDGDDTLVIHDNTNIIGTVDAGAGNNTLETNIAIVADLGAVQGFQTLDKTGTGELNINGPLSSDFTTVNVREGILDVTAGGSVIPAPGNTLDTFVASGATLNVDGNYGCGAGNDTMTVAGNVSGTGTIDLCDGDDTLTLQDGAVLANAISGGSGTGDTLVLDNAGALTFDAGNTADFELLQKNNTGIATLTGAQNFTGGTAINAGTLDVDGALATPTVDLAGGTTLNVDGTLEAGGGTAATVTGDAGANTVSVGIGGTLLANGDLGEGNDVLDIAGTLDTGGGVFALGDGDDNFIVHDGTVVIGTVDGGAGFDTRTYAINTSADLGALLNFEGVTKTGTGVLNITGPGATDLQQVEVLEGTLDVHAGASIVATAGESLDTLVADGATLNVDGAFGCGDGADTLNVSGTVSGSGTVNLCGGDDTLTLNDGADIAGLINPVDGDAGDDRVVLNNAGVLSLDGSDIANFEVLQKDNIGEAILTGAHGFTGGAELNGGTLTVDGTLDTPMVVMGDGTVLDVNGLLQAGGGTAAVLTGSTGVNTVNVGQGGLLIASGDLGDGDDVLDVAGILDTGGGVFSLGDGSDTFTIHDGTVVLGTVDGGAGLDTFNPDIDTSADLGALTNFEILTKTGIGVLNVNGPGQSDFVEVNVLEGTLNIGPAAGLGGVQDAIVAGGATLNLDGDLLFTTGDDTLTVAGTVTGGGTLDMGDGNDTFTLQDGANLSGLATPVSGGAGTDTFVADLAGSAVLGGAVDFETLTKTNVGTLHVDGPAMSAFATVNVDGGTLDIGVAGSLNGVQDATVASGASLIADGSMLFTAGADNFTVAGTVSGSGIIDMLDGDDNLILQDGADLSGLDNAIDGGAGTDTLTADIAGTATLGGVTNFETLSKTNTGTLIVAGPAPSDFTTVNVDGGTLDVGVAGSISGVVTSTVAGGATLNVDGSYSGSAGDDTMTVAGAINGDGTIFFDDGDDVLTLNDGADLSGFSGTLDGGAHSGGDTVALNNAMDLTFGAGAVINFEFLSKTNTGTATLTGTQGYSGGTTLAGGALVVDGGLTTPSVAMSDDTTLTVDGALDAGTGTAAVITGSDGVNTVIINGTALATGDLGAGEDVLDVTGTLDTGGGVFALGDGDDTFVVHDGTVVLGTVDGGAGLDTRVYDINLTAELGALVNFEGVTKTGSGVLNITGPGTTDLQEVSVLGGTLNIGPDASVAAIAGGPLDSVIASGATLHVDGSYGCGDSDDTMTVAGTVSGTGTIDLCGGEDVLTLQDGAVLANIISGGSHGSGDTVVLDTANAFTFDASNTINFEYLQKDNAGEATLVGAQSFTGGTTLNGGTLTVAGQLQTPTLALADDTVLNVDGRLDAVGGTAVTITGSAGVNTVTVGEGGTLLATGDLGDGNDVLDVAGTLDTLGGTFDLGDGDDTLTIHDDTHIIGTVAAGEGNDTFNADIATQADLGAVQDFETLSKTSGGVLNVNGPASSDFTTVNVLGGTLNVTAGGSVMAQTTTVAAGATLDVQGSYTGTDGDDSFTSQGTVRGAFAFGDGNDTVAFIGGDPSGVTSLDGGLGSDLLSFSGLELESATLPVLTSWERVELLDNSTLNLANALDLGGGVLAIDGTSQLLARVGAAIGGSVENAGLIDVGMNRLAISGNYTGNEGLLRLTVSPGTLSAGGLDIGGDVAGTTRVAFAGDGSDFTQGGTASILVISSPNDNAATAGGFEAAEDVIRLEGSIYPWSFGQQADNNWYLNAEAGVLPEVPGYGVLPTLGLLAVQNSDNLIHQRLAGVRGRELPQCGITPEWPVQHAGTEVIDDCRGVWVAATGSEVELGANPGFEVSGDDVGLYVGVDSAFDRPGRTLRGGIYLGYRHGNYWTTGVNSTDLPGSGLAHVQIDTLVAGMYMSHTWDSGGYLNFVLTGHLPRASIRTSDGFSEHIPGNSLSLSSRVGHRYRLQGDWTLEPQAQLTVSAVGWGSKIDQSGKEVGFDDDLVTTARAGLRIEKEIARGNGALIRPWATFAVQRIIGQNDTSVSLMTPGATGDAQAFPNHQLGTSATLEVGVEATVNQRVSLFGVLSVGKQLDGTDYEQREANLGVRVRW
ncbi:autotransporter-associated beta strand repeat-containing protein [Pseudoxanthomonas wuyuanensis]|uniref:Fibronectin-binding autotransporter adhesin n=1 Tax=Pseudoxanthomonas wuyuanensis TaxID=1073196 RepID=A0A286CYX9_9GAMM|nr:autotransporter-associated beta strand repeat-containing protein [Pseudoxanthomonas wuyuanensis]SOD51569.1 fibronectin-binding autotransporter adhesin [Pseudoxanthomonas wuyuanensis]